MLFQTFDDKQSCFMVYKEAKFHKTITPTCTQTWSYASYLRDQEVEYASIYALGASMEEVCNDKQKIVYNETQAKIKAFRQNMPIRSNASSSISDLGRNQE